MARKAQAKRSKQEFLVDSLPEKRRLFVIAYCGEAAGNATAAARTAGYAAPSEEGYRLLRNAQILEAIEEMQLALGTDTHSLIAGPTELRVLWTQVARGEISDVQVIRDRDGERAEETIAPIARRLEAARDLAKSQGLLDQKHHVAVTITEPKDAADARSKAEQIVAQLGGHVVWNDEPDEEGGEDE